MDEAGARQIGMHCKPGDRWASWFADHGLVPRTKIISEHDEPDRVVEYTEALDPGRAAVMSWSPPPVTGVRAVSYTGGNQAATGA